MINNIDNSKRVALAIMRAQPLHRGHSTIINTMIADYETVILGIGSTQISREKWNPWTFEERKTMVRNVYGDRIKIVQFQDLETSEGSNAWVDYVLQKIRKLGLADPTDYYTGSQADARWYTNRFFLKGVSAWDDSDKFASHINEHNGRYYINGFFREMHLVDRATNPTPPATDIRTLLELRDNSWEQWVPAVNHQFIKDTYPEEFKVSK